MDKFGTTADVSGSPALTSAGDETGHRPCLGV
jgi:hypothetical protein